MKLNIVFLTLCAVATASAPVDNIQESVAEPITPQASENPADIMKLKQMIHDKKCGKVAKKCPPPAPKCQVVYKTVNKTVTKTVQPKQECKPTKQAKCGKQGC